MTDAAATLSPPRLDIGSLISRTVAVIQRNLATFVLLAVIFAFIPGVISGAVNYKVNSTTMSSMNFVWDAFTHRVNPASAFNSNVLWLTLLSGVGTLFLEAAVVGAVVANLDGRAAPSLASVWPHILPLAGIFIVVYLAFLVGLVLLVVPGVILGLAFSVAGPVRVAEGRGVFGSIQRSRDLTRGMRWKILLLFVLFFVAELLVGTLAGAVKVALHVPMEMWAISVAPAINAAVRLIGTVGLAVIYVGLRAAKEGGSASDVAAAFS
jgi:hypothetical protein